MPCIRLIHCTLVMQQYQSDGTASGCSDDQGHICYHLSLWLFRPTLPLLCNLFTIPKFVVHLTTYSGWPKVSHHDVGCAGS